MPALDGHLATDAAKREQVRGFPKGIGNLKGCRALDHRPDCWQDLTDGVAVHSAFFRGSVPDSRPRFA